MSKRLRLVLLALGACAFAALAWWLSGILSPTPPRSLTIATGPQGSAYAVVAQRYREILARTGVDLRLRPTAGSVENLALLRDPRSGVSAAFLQGGLAVAADAPELVSLGTLFYEPVWLFRRATGRPTGADTLCGKRLAIGQDGSGTRLLALRLLGFAGIDERNAVLLPLGPQDAADALVTGSIDAAVIVASWHAPSVQRLLAAPGIEVISFARADAQVARNPFLSKLVLPAGVVDLVRNIPPADVVLLAPKASLVVCGDLHPALQYLLLDAASAVHAPPDVFNHAGEFPAAEAIDVPLAENARQYYKSGRPFLQRYLPFWLASLAGRLIFVLVPLFGVVLPLLRWLPGLFGWNVRRKIYRLYVDLKRIDLEAEALPAGADTSALAARLDALEQRAGHLRFPRFYASTAYTFRHHVRLVRERLETRRERVGPAVPAGS